MFPKLTANVPAIPAVACVRTRRYTTTNAAIEGIGVLATDFSENFNYNLNRNIMKINNSKITMLINPDYTHIEITDSDANTVIASVRLTPEQLSKILSRQGFVDCECETGELSRIGKKHENKYFTFKAVYSTSETDLALACNEALFNQGMYEWTSDNRYNSQNSLFKKRWRTVRKNSYPKVDISLLLTAACMLSLRN